MGVFSKDQGGKKTLKRNTYPVSRQINTTFNFGQLIPFSLREINPGESVKIRPSVGLRFMPTYFPVQNKMKCYINYFYVRSRNLYKDFKQFYEDNSPSTSHPYLAFPSSLASSRSRMFSVGGLADHMGISVTRHVGPNDIAFNIPLSATSGYFYSVPFRFSNIGNSPYVPFGERPVLSTGNPSDYIFPTDFGNTSPRDPLPFGRAFGFSIGDVLGTSSKPYSAGTYTLSLRDLPSSVLSYLDEHDFNIFYCYCLVQAKPSSSGKAKVISGILPLSFSNSLESHYHLDDDVSLSIHIPSSLSIDIDSLPSSSPAGPYTYRYSFVPFVVPSSSPAGESYPVPLPVSLSPVSDPVDFRYASSTVVSVGDTLSSFNPFSEELDAESFVPLNSMPFRAYEQIYNAFYRDERNNPLMRDGKPVYDEFLLNTDGGRDCTDYKIHYRNWEQDPYTTALPSPQQGIAPLVGISSTGIATFQDLESGKQYTVRSIVDDSGDKVVNAEFTEDSLKDMNSDWKPSVARALVSYATSGISINDFRNVNALQRFKELNLRRGRKYKDLMEARFGVNISYAEMNMPEFIGGASFDVQPVQVNQTTNQGENDPLGSYAGQLFASGGSKHSITKFCDEHGYIIGIISVVPTPVYETVTPKLFFKHHLLDFWQPEFNHIGLQPIPMKELDVFGQHAKSPDNMDEEFGYQRPWYDYISALDSVHGQFRTSLSSFVMYRSWSEPPSLSPDFLLVDPSSGIDDVFSVRTDSEGNSVDKILGQIYEDYTIKSPVSKFGIAKLE